MDFLTIAVGLLLTFTLLMGLSSLPKRGKKLPPGPIRWPIIGSIHLLGNQPHQSLAKLAKTYGPIMSLKLGQITTIVVSSSELAKEILKTQDLAFCSRKVPNSLHAHDEYKYSVIWLPVASRWKSLRRVLTTNVFSAKRLDDNHQLRSKKVQELIDYCRKCSETGEAVNIGRAALRTSLNSLSNTVFSKDVTDPFSDSAKEFKQLLCDITLGIGTPNLVDFFPILAKIDPQGIRRRMNIHMGKIFELIRELIDERLTSGMSQGSVGDVLDVLLTTSHETPELIDRKHIEHLLLAVHATVTMVIADIHQKLAYTKCPKCDQTQMALFNETFPCHTCKEEQVADAHCKVVVKLNDNSGTIDATLFDNCAEQLLGHTPKEVHEMDKQDMFIAGTDTTTSTLEWTMAEMLKNPDEMKKVQDELAQVIGRGNVVKEAHIARLPYLQCVVKETLRLHSPGPFLIPREAVQQAEVCGYNVPKGSQVLINIWAIARDETLWRDALKFMPDRFLESKIEMYGQDFELLPFGAGRRICPGLPLVFRMVHVMLGSLLNCFNWELEGGITPEGLNMEERFGLTLPMAHQLHVVPIPL